MRGGHNPPRVFGRAAEDTSEGSGEDRVESYEWRMGSIVAGIYEHTSLAVQGKRRKDCWLWSVGYVRADGHEYDLLENNPEARTAEEAAGAIEAAIVQLMADLGRCIARSP